MAITSSGSSVIAFFATEAKAAQAVQALKTAGFTRAQIGAATPHSGASVSPVSTLGHESHGATGSMAGGTMYDAGAKTEGVWDKIKDFFEGGPNEGGVEQYAGEHAHAGASHEVTAPNYFEPEDMSHSLAGMDVPQERSRYFEHRLQSSTGGVVVTVTAVGRKEEAEAILEQHGGDLGAGAAEHAFGETTETGQQRIQLLGEVLRVHKERTTRGEVRIRKEIITDQQTIQVPVTREELVIERIAASGATPAHGSIGENSEIRIPLSEEHASVDKQTVVLEEVAVGKRAIEGTESVSDSVRHEELQVEETAGAGTLGR